MQATLRDLAMMMVIVSDNSATNLLLDRVGGPRQVNATMRDWDYPRSSSTAESCSGNHHEWQPGRGGAARPDATGGMLAREELVSPAASREMLAILGRQRYLEQAPRFVAYRPYAGDFGLPQPITVFNKTGFINGLRADTGLITIDPDVRIAYSVVNDAGPDATYRQDTRVTLSTG